MRQLNHQKRIAHKRKVQAALQQILNDSAIMPNASCSDLLVSVSRVEFGSTVGEIYIDVFGRWRKSMDCSDESPHDKYLREAREAGDETYIDLTEVFHFPKLTNIIAVALQKHLDLMYTPVIHQLADRSDL